MDEESSLPITDEFNQGIIHTNLNQDEYKYMGYFITSITLHNLTSGAAGVGTVLQSSIPNRLSR